MKRFANLASFLLLVATCFAWTTASQGAPTDDQKKPAEKPKLLSEQSRIWILRGLNAEAATVRKPLPHTDKGLILHPDGKIDETALAQDMREHGPAARAGEVVRITAIKFEKDKIVFQINGGARGGKGSWRDRIQVSGPVGVQTTQDPNAAAPKTGSAIQLVFNERVPDITVDDLKQMLSPVLDFNRRSATMVYAETLPKEVQAAIKDHKVTEGMDHDMVLASLGKPERKLRESKRGVDTEDWIYGNPPSKVTIVTFEEDKVIKVQVLTPGIPMTDVPRAEPEKPQPPVKKQ